MSQTLTPICHSIRAPGSYLCGLAWDGRYLWHSDQIAGKFFALGSSDGIVRQVIEYQGIRGDLTFIGNHLCQVGERPRRLIIVDPATGSVVDKREVLPKSARLMGIDIGEDGDLWMCLRDPGVLQRRDWETLSVQDEVAVPGRPSGLTCVGGIVVYSEFEDGLLRAVDARSGIVTGQFKLPSRPTGVAWDGRYLWYCDMPAARINALAVSPSEWDGMRASARLGPIAS